MYLTGPVLPKTSLEQLENRWAAWLGGFKRPGLVYSVHLAGKISWCRISSKAYRLSILSCSKATARSYNHGRGLTGGIPREGGREGDVAWLRKIIKLKENGQINITKFLSFSIIYQVFQKQ